MRRLRGPAVRCGLALTLAAALASPPPAAAGEAEILARVEEFFAIDDPRRRAELASEIGRDEAFERGRLSEWLHRAALHPAVPPGVETMTVEVGLGRARAVTVRVPQGYRPDRPWPVLYLLHPSGGSGPGFLPYAEQTLGPRVEEYLVVAPTDYRQTGLDAPPPFTADHSAILRAVRTRFHVDADRQYALGFSLGGYASWNMALLHAEETAGAVPIGSCITVPPTEDGLWRDVLGNLAHVSVLNVWGSADGLVVYDSLGERAGTVVELNHRFIAATAGSDLPVRHLEVAGAGHAALPIAWEDLEPVLTHRRPHYPARVEHAFRHLHQGRAYWLEAHSWEGESWGAEPLPIAPAPGESPLAAFGRVARARLGRLHGQVQGQTVRVNTVHVRELTVWVGDEGRDWRKPLTLLRNGKRLFRERLQPDLLLALTQAARTHDFDNLRWAGWRLDASARAAVVTAATPFPPPLP